MGLIVSHLQRMFITGKLSRGWLGDPESLTTGGLIHAREMDSFMWGSYPASLWNVGGSIRAWNNAEWHLKSSCTSKAFNVAI